MRTLGYSALVVATLIALQAFLLHLFGQPFTSETGQLMLWSGDIYSAENSQQFSDWYTFSHIIHGLIFYFVLRYLAPRLSVWQRLIIALGAEVSWEIVENTPWLIEHYRQQALAQGYVGDSILNSISDTLAMLAGFLLAARAPLWASVALVFGCEAWVLYWIRDGLVLNILGFFWTPEVISSWQSAK